MRELLKAASMDARKRKAPRPNLNRCKLCKEKAELTPAPPGMELKGPVCHRCENWISVQRKLGRICVHARSPAECRQKTCIVRYVMES